MNTNEYKLPAKWFALGILGIFAFLIGAMVASTAKAASASQHVDNFTYTNAASYASSYSSGYNRQDQGQGQGQALVYAPQIEAADLRDRAPTIFVPNLTSGSISCAVSVSAGFSVPGGAASLGVAYESKECNVRQTLQRISSVLAGSNDPRAEVILKSVACQSPIMWDSLELAAIEANDSNLACKNERPATGGKFFVRKKRDLPEGYDAMTEDEAVTTSPAASEAKEFDFSVMGG